MQLATAKGAEKSAGCIVPMTSECLNNNHPLSFSLQVTELESSAKESEPSVSFGVAVPLKSVGLSDDGPIIEPEPLLSGTSSSLFAPSQTTADSGLKNIIYVNIKLQLS